MVTPGLDCRPPMPSCGVREIRDKSREQKVAESEVEGFREKLGPFVVAAETTRMAMVFTDAKEPDNPIIFANGSFLSLTGYAREEVLGQSFNFLLAHAADAGEAQAALLLAGTYDPIALQKLGLQGPKVDIEKARTWYQRAQELGSAAAPGRLQLLAGYDR
jgi:PAS domain-containing protein